MLALTMIEDLKHERFLALYGHSQRRMYAYIRSQVLTPHDADDVFQEVSTVLWKRFDEYQSDTDFTRWACILAWTEVLVHHRHRKRLLQTLHEDVADALGHEVLELTSGANDRLDALAQCVESLPLHSRDVLRRRYHRDRSIKQIAAEVGRSESAIYKALQQIHDALFDCVEKRLAGSSAS
jgi:RNA polymerase sigma-70 factor (ECF subfamily)